MSCASHGAIVDKPDPPHVIALADAAERYIPRNRGLELARNMAYALTLDPTMDATKVARTMVEHRVTFFSLTVAGDDVSALVSAIAAAWRRP